jgi:hypothetical protein
VLCREKPDPVRIGKLLDVKEGIAGAASGDAIRVKSLR